MPAQVIFRMMVSIGFLALLAGCTGTDHDGAQIPPPYQDDFEKRKDADRLAFLTDCIRKRIDPAGSYYKRAQLYLEKGDFKAALSDATDAIEAKDNVGEYYLLRGIINRELNQLSDALLDAERAEALQQKSPKLYVLMADILQENKKYAESRRYINGILALAPHDASVYYVQGMLQAKTGDTTGGLASMEKAITLNPAYLRAYPKAAALYRQRGDFTNSSRILQNGLQHFPANKELILGMGKLYAEQALPDSALPFYERAVKLSEDDLELRAEMADLYVRARNYSSALTVYEAIQRRKPEYTAINYLIGFCQEKMWRLNTAKSYYEQELEINPGYVPARNGIWRISQLENERELNAGSTGESPEPAKTLDDTRLNISPIQPRKIQK